MSRVRTRKEGSKVNASEAASRVGEQVYHAGQGQDERAHPRLPHLLRGLDSAWSGGSNPHRESGTRWWAAADVGATGTAGGPAHGRPRGRDGNRLGDSVGANSPHTGERPRSVEDIHVGTPSRGERDSGGVLPRRMRLLGRFKGGGLIAGLVDPHAIDDAHPDVGQAAHRHAVGLALGPFALVVLPRPGFLPRRLPGKLLQMVAQRLAAGEAFVRFGVIAAFKGDRSCAGQSLDAGGVGIATAILTPLGQQTGSQPLAGSRQRTPDLVVVMRQKKGLNGLLVAGNLLDDHQQLLDQREHQPRLGAHHHLSGNQLGTVELVKDLASRGLWVGMLACAQGSVQLFQRGRGYGLRSGIGLQKQQGRALLQFAEQLQGHRVVLLEAGRQLIDQPRLRLDQGILIARERFQLLNRGAIGLQAVQFRQLQPTQFGQQMRVYAIGFGPRGFAQLIGPLGVDGIDGDTGFQEEGDQQAMIDFDNACHLLRISGDAQDKLFQLMQALVVMGKTPDSHALACFIEHLHVVMGVSPIQPNVPHTRQSFSSIVLGRSGPSITGARSTSLQASIGPGKLPGEERSFLTGRAVWRQESFPGSASRAGSFPASPWSRGLG